MGQVKEKLNKDGKDYRLVTEVQRITNPEQMHHHHHHHHHNKHNIPTQMPYTLSVAKYEQDPNSQKSYDEILSAIGEYFELFKHNTNLLEDMWLQILGYLNFNPPTQTT